MVSMNWNEECISFHQIVGANDSLLHRELSEGRTERRESLVNRSKLSLR